MRQSIYAFFTLLAYFQGSAFALPEQHLELEMTSKEYQNLLQERFTEKEKPKHILDPVMEMGKRSLQWLEYINEHREPEEKISFSSVATQPAYPIDQPRISNPDLILKEFNEIKASLPEWYSEILFDGGEFTEDPPVSDEEYKELGIKIDFNYKRASRWLLQEPNLDQYAARRRDDVRGYYYANLDTHLSEELKKWETLELSVKNRISGWLIGMCRNANQTEANCKTELAKTIDKDKTPVAFNTKYFPFGKRRWDGYFELSVKRPDVEWGPNKPDLMILPFQEPPSLPLGVKDFLVNNIQDEWKWGTWKLELFFTTSKNHPKIEFESGATPHVNGLGGSIITMDANQPLTEYDAQWTIRHEFGHVIGFPDCYVEFYDTDAKQMISYQLDITNLMCSRRGKLQAKHLEQLKKMYLE